MNLSANLVPVNSLEPVSFTGSLVIGNDVIMKNSRMPCWPSSATVNSCKLRSMWDNGFKLFGGDMNVTKIVINAYVSLTRKNQLTMV